MRALLQGFAIQAKRIVVDPLRIVGNDRGRRGVAGDDASCFESDGGLNGQCCLVWRGSNGVNADELADWIKRVRDEVLGVALQ